VARALLPDNARLRLVPGSRSVISSVRGLTHAVLARRLAHRPGRANVAAMPDEEVPVLIVGGSLVGLTTAMLLGHHGVSALAVERHAGTAIHPRAGHFQLRTMELLRQLGLEARVRDKSLETYSPTGGIIAVESLAGRELATYVKELNEGVEGFSPTVRVFINQDVLEPLLRERALELGAKVRNRTEAVALEQDEDGVSVTLRDLDSGDEREIRARYVVAADGNRSPMRGLLGIAMRGYGRLSRSITIYFRADCAELLRDRNQGVLYVHNPKLRGFFRLDRTGGNGFLVINTVGEDVTQESAVEVQAGLTHERALEFLRTAIGTDMPMEIVDIAPWQAEANCAERLRAGRVFLAGDAGHVVPPNGGFGGNTGVNDAHNLAWKLAAVVKGEAGPGLLDTYEAERLPLCELTVRQAYTRYATRVVPERGTEDAEPPVPDIELEIGLVMRSPAILVEDGDDGVLHLPPPALDGRPGTRAPHVWLADDRSTLDLFGSGFVVLRPAGRDVDDWAPPGATSHVIDAEPFAASYGLAAGGATLVRPGRRGRLARSRLGRT
jgi:2-polyprenyl-6-methoxyphenol hydroxylase-like FAD-dependent oxidoreductase